MLSINTAAAEPGAFIFDGTGKVAYYHVQHDQQPDELRDFESNPLDGRTDDLIRLTGFKFKQQKYQDDDDQIQAVPEMIYRKTIAR